MPRAKTDLHSRVRAMLAHTVDLPSEASRPIKHFERNTNSSRIMLDYIDRKLAAAGGYPSVSEKHVAAIRRMVLASLIESFERFLKEIAALCIDHLAPNVHDDRFDGFSFKGGQLASHISSGSIGKALCESDTWVANKTTNERFRRLLKLPFGDDWEFLFPEGNQTPASERDRARTLAILWQVRHTITHNVGVVTGSDAVRLRMLLRGCVVPERILNPDDDVLRYVKHFLFDTANSVNRRIGERLAKVLTELHKDDPSLFDPGSLADQLSIDFGFSVSVGDHVGKSVDS